MRNATLTIDCVQRRQRYPAYKPTGIPWLGQIPDHWTLFRTGDHARMNALLDPAVDRFKAMADNLKDHVPQDEWCRTKEEQQEEFRSLLHNFCNLYAFLSQIIPYQDSDLEKLYTDMGFPQTTRNAALQEWIPEAPPVGPGDGAIEDDPFVSSARDAVLAAQEKVTAARGEYYPTVALTFQYNYLGIDPSSMRRAFDGTHANNYTVGLGVTLPLLPFINVNADIDAARATVLSAQGQYQGALVSVTNRLTDASVKLVDAQNTLDLATRAAELARRNLRLTQDKYAAHQADLRDVDTAKVLSAQSEQSFSIATINFRLAAWEQYRALHPKEFPATLLEAVAGPGSPER